MITPGSVNPLLMAGGRETTPCGGSVIKDPAYKISRSLRFRPSAYTAFTRTFPSEPKVWSISLWFKASNFTDQIICGFRQSGRTSSYIGTNGTRLVISLNERASLMDTQFNFRDPSAWYHLVVSGTQGGKLNAYVNGVLVGSVAMGASVAIFTHHAGFVNAIGRNGDANVNLFDGYMADFHFIEGLALDANSFGAANADTGVWQAKAYAGTYGANGFWLKFDDTAQIGKDSSGNNNHWTPHNIDVSAPGTQATYDSMKDSPTPYDDGTANPPGNYGTLNPIGTFYYPNTHFVDGNLKSTAAPTSLSTMCANAGKWYAECVYTTRASTQCQVGVQSIDPVISVKNILPCRSVGSVGMYSNANKSVDNTGSPYGSGFGDNAVIGVALDIDGGQITFFVNGASYGAIPYNFKAYKDWCFANGWGGTVGSDVFVWNFGQHPWKYAPPAGFKAFCTQNLPYCDPFIKPDGTAAHNVTLTLAAGEFRPLGYVPTAGANWGVQADKLANGIKAIQAGTYTITNPGERFKTGLAQGNP